MTVVPAVQQSENFVVWEMDEEKGRVWAYTLKDVGVKQIFKIERWSMHLGPGHSIVRENRLKLPSCRSATLLVSAVSPTNHLASEEEGILAACASALDCRKKSGFTVKFHDFSLFSC